MKRQFFPSIAAAIAFVTILMQAEPVTLHAPVIEFYNKNQDSIQVNIIDISGSSQKTITTAYVSGDQQWNSGSRVINMTTKLLIELLKQNKLIARFEVDAPGKTKYMSIDLNKTPALYPQTGPLLGLMGKTKSGLPLKNNVSAGQIRQIK